MPSVLSRSRGLKVVRSDDRASDLVGWAERLATMEEGGTVPELMVRLRQLADSSLGSDTRYRILRGVKRPLLKAAAGRGPAPQPGAGMSIEQRLYGVMSENLKRLLELVDRERGGVADHRGDRRLWAIRNLYRFMQRDLLAAVQGGRPWSPGAWQRLHDVFVYLVLRGDVQLHEPALGVAGDGELDPEQAYKQTLLVGLISERLGPRALDAKMLQRLALLASECRLVEADAVRGEYGQILVEVGRDRPPELMAGALDEPFRGWVLQGPESLLALICGAILD